MYGWKQAKMDMKMILLLLTFKNIPILIFEGSSILYYTELIRLISYLSSYLGTGRSNANYCTVIVEIKFFKASYLLCFILKYTYILRLESSNNCQKLGKITT